MEDYTYLDYRPRIKILEGNYCKLWIYNSGQKLSMILENKVFQKSPLSSIVTDNVLLNYYSRCDT